MTFEDLKDLFTKYRYAEKNLTRLRRAVANVESDIANIRSALASVGMPHNPNNAGTPTERLLIKLEQVRAKYFTAMEEYMQAEDNLTAAFWQAQLTEEERDIIIDSYVYRKPAWKIATETNYAERTIRRRRKSAMEKLQKK